MAEQLVTIVVPCYNLAEWLPETLESIQSQVYKNWECIIIDDGSTDNTPQVSQNWCSHDARFKYIHQKNQGLSAARNAGIAIASGTLILPLDSDDTIQPDYLAKTVERIQQSNDIRIVFTGVQLFGSINDRWEFCEFALSEFLFRNLIPCTALFYKEDWGKVGRYKTNMKGGFEDWDFWMSIVERGGQVSLVREYLFNYRQRSNSMASQISPELALKLKRTLALNHLKFYAMHLGDPLTLTIQLREQQRRYELLRKSKAFKLGSVLLKPFKLLMGK